MNVAVLLQRVAACGYRIRVTHGGPVLEPARSECLIPGPLLKALKDNRAAVLEFLTECRLCQRDVRDPEDRERLATINPFCRETPCPYRGSGS